MESNLPRLNNLDDLINLLKILDEQEKIDGLGFDMNTEYRNKDACGSACCIGGWVQACNPETRMMTTTAALSTITEHNFSDCREICWPEHSELYHATTKHAIKVLEIFRDTGKSTWNIFYDAETETLLPVEAVF